MRQHKGDCGGPCEMEGMGKEGPVIYTVGHSNRSAGDFIMLLKSFRIQTCADIRSYPGSRRSPQFNRNALRESLNSEGILYTHLPGLGGFRESREDSPNKGLHDNMFRGYADYMLTADFDREVEKLISLAGTSTTAIMCAERDRRQCHRNLLSDSLAARGVRVRHLIDRGLEELHEITPWAELEGFRLYYR
ncbi:MAG: DUF488 domain-containing protein [Candidatus Eremiobacteraeota bacterium]|nr:DUF488 domain-containing protein [Candidatus Eremiobacteraeota bacterium]